MSNMLSTCMHQHLIVRLDFCYSIFELLAWCSNYLSDYIIALLNPQTLQTIQLAKDNRLVAIIFTDRKL